MAVIASCAFQVFCRMASVLLAAIALVPPAKGSSVMTVSPRICAAALACAMRSGGVSTLNSGTVISPVSAFSIRDSNCRAMRKDDGTMPLAEPECTPSFSTVTVRVPITMPRSEVVSHNCW